MHLSLRQRKALWGYAFLALPLIFFLVVRIYPALSALNMSLHQWDVMSARKPFVGLRNFVELWHDQVFWKAALNTLLYVVISVPLELILGLLVAVTIQSVNRFRGFYRTIYFVPYITSTVAVSWVWRWMYFKNGGVFNQILLSLGLPAQSFLSGPEQALYCVTAVVVWQALGYYVVIFLAGLEMVPSMYKEAAKIDGASSWHVFRYVTLPLLNPTVVFLAVLGTINSLQIFTQIMNMTSGGYGQGDLGGPLNSTLSLVVYIYKQAFYRFQMGYASAITVVLFAIILVATLIELKVLSRRVEY
ncbi:MAG: sugar ABC transporter permease [Firmicutes bacterium]|nr:sugar ABC transporter permease [Bacillota bacterium]MDH7494836.1 sugar ABC transporter permease [Bacillota bacterium]